MVYKVLRSYESRYVANNAGTAISSERYHISVNYRSYSEAGPFATAYCVTTFNLSLRTATGMRIAEAVWYNWLTLILRQITTSTFVVSGVSLPEVDTLTDNLERTSLAFLIR